VVNFSRHQNPHRDEKASTLPTPCEHGANTVPSQGKTGTSTASTLRPNHLPPEGTPPVVPQPDAPKTEPPQKPEKPRTDSQKRSDAIYERRFAIFEAYCRGLGIDPESMPGTQRKGPSLSTLTVQILDTPECDPATIEALTRYTFSAFQWRNGSKTPSLREVLAAFPEWDQQGRPDHVPGKSPNGYQNGRASPRQSISEMMGEAMAEIESKKVGGATVIEAEFRSGDEE
jgi:hypothetical protein